MKDQTIVCIQCGTEFKFTINEQRRCERMGFDEPRRCPVCRKNKTKPIGDQNGPSKVDRKAAHRHGRRGRGETRNGSSGTGLF